MTIDGVRAFVEGSMDEMYEKAHDEAKNEVDGYEPEAFKKQIREKTEEIIQMVELTQMTNKKQNPHTLELSITHPTCEGAQTSLEAIKLRDESISPLECDIAVSSWIPDGAVGAVALQIEFAITLIQGQINLGAQNGQRHSRPEEIPQRDIDDAQEQRLKEKLVLPITPHSQF